MIDIPTNNAKELENLARTQHERELDAITTQILKDLKDRAESYVHCEEHAICDTIHHLCDVKAVAQRFKAKGYHCYYYDFYNKGGVNQRCVVVRKVKMPEHELVSTSSSLVWHEI